MPLPSVHSRNLGSRVISHEAVPGSLSEQQACRQMGCFFAFLLRRPTLTQKPNETASRVNLAELET